MPNSRPGQPRLSRTAARVVRLKPTVRLVAAFAILLVAPLSLARTANAQAQPPNRYFGAVSINGQDQPEGTVVEAYIGNTLCGSGTVQSRNGATIYLVDVLGSGQKANCAKDGDKVTFKVAGLDAKESGTYETAAATHLDLTATGTARNGAQPTVLAPGTGGTPAPPPPIPTSPIGTSTPPPGVTETPPEQASATPEASGTETATPGASATATETATATATAGSTANNGTRSSRRSSGPPAALWIVIVLAVLAIGAGAGALVYQRRPRA